MPSASPILSLSVRSSVCLPFCLPVSLHICLPLDQGCQLPLTKRGWIKMTHTFHIYASTTIGKATVNCARLQHIAYFEAKIGSLRTIRIEFLA